MKSTVTLLKIAALVLVTCSLIVGCKTTAATHKHEFKKELHRVERAH